MPIDLRKQRCSACHHWRPLTAFHVKNRATGRRQDKCTTCKAAYNRAWYERNRARHLAAVHLIRAASYARNSAMVSAAKDRPCADCGRRFPPCAMDFDHVRGQKSANIGELKSGVARQRLLDEMAKCEVVCANCHRIRTFMGRDVARRLGAAAGEEQ